MSTEINTPDNKKVWNSPTLEIVSVDETISGFINTGVEAGYSYHS